MTKVTENNTSKDESLYEKIRTKAAQVKKSVSARFKMTTPAETPVDQISEVYQEQKKRLPDPEKEEQEQDDFDYDDLVDDNITGDNNENTENLELRTVEQENPVDEQEEIESIESEQENALENQEDLSFQDSGPIEAKKETESHPESFETQKFTEIKFNGIDFTEIEFNEIAEELDPLATQEEQFPIETQDAQIEDIESEQENFGETQKSSESAAAKEQPKAVVETMRIADIKIPKNRRKVDYEYVNELADSIQDIGLLNPVNVTPNKILIAGGHRIEACKILRWDVIPFTEVNIDGIVAELAQIDENFVRHELKTAERAELLKRRKEIYEQIHPETKHGKASKSELKKLKRKDEIISSFTEDTSQKTGITKRTIEQEVQIANNITPETKEVIKGTPVENKKIDLLDLSREKDPVKQLKLAKAVIDGDAKNVKEAKQNASPKRKEEQFDTEIVRLALLNIIENNIEAIFKYISAAKLKKLLKDFGTQKG